MSAEPRPEASAAPAWRSSFVAVQALSLLALWLVLSGHWDAFHIGVGVMAVGFVVWLNRPLHAVRLEPGGPARPMRIWRFAVYLPWLFAQMLSSALYVAYLSLHPRCPVAPLLLRFRSHQPSLTAQVVLGNSITLTPGTLTLEIHAGELTVHALSERSADGLISGTMPRRVARLFGTYPEPPLTDVRKLRSRHELLQDHG